MHTSDPIRIIPSTRRRAGVLPARRMRTSICIAQERSCRLSAAAQREYRKYCHDPSCDQSLFSSRCDHWRRDEKQRWRDRQPPYLPPSLISFKNDAKAGNVALCSSVTVPSTMCWTGPCCCTSRSIFCSSSGVG